MSGNENNDSKTLYQNLSGPCHKVLRAACSTGLVDKNSSYPA
jgi:hypothetical protein